MKKVLSVLLVFAMCTVLMTGCGESGGGSAAYKLDISPYDSLNYSEYVKLPDYASFPIGEPEVNITEEDVENEIQARLDAASTETEKVTEGTVQEGDAVTISFNGTLSDGSSPEGMNSEGYDIVLGEASMIDGFQEGLYGAVIGEPVTLELQFPDPYEVDPDLSGEPVTFVVTVLSKSVPVQVAFDEDFMSADSEGKAKNEADYRTFIRNYLEETGMENAIYDLQTQYYYDISDAAEILKYPEDIVASESEALMEQYKTYAENYQMEWEDFVTQYFGDEETFKSQLDEYIKTTVGRKLIIYALCEAEDIKVTDQEYSDRVGEYLASFGTDAETFQNYYGVSIDEYCRMYEVGLNMYLDKFLVTMYEKIKK